MVKKLSLVQGICRIVGVTRKRPKAGSLNKRELQTVLSQLTLIKQNEEQPTSTRLAHGKR